MCVWGWAMPVVWVLLGVFFKKKKIVQQKVMKKLCSANCKKKKRFVHKTGRKMKLYRGKSFACSFA